MIDVLDVERELDAGHEQILPFRCQVLHSGSGAYREAGGSGLRAFTPELEGGTRAAR